jgi:hypothetical protein
MSKYLPGGAEDHDKLHSAYFFQINYKSGAYSYSAGIHVAPAPPSPNHEKNYLQMDMDQGLRHEISQYMVTD